MTSTETNFKPIYNLVPQCEHMKPWPSDMFFMYGTNVVVWMANDVPVEMFKKDSERAKFKKDKTSERSWFKRSLYK